jgi:hypothetical protein
MLQPRRAQADQAKVLETLYEIKDTDLKAFIDEAPTDLAPYGLLTPNITVSIWEQGQKGAQMLRIGGRDRQRRGYYANFNSARNIILLEENLVKSLLAGNERWKEAG